MLCLDGCPVSTQEHPFAKGTYLSPEDLARVRDIIPGFEPSLGRCAGGPRRGKTYPVAETFLVGNERAYLNQCIDFELDIIERPIRR